MTNEDREVVWRGQFNVWGQSTAEHSTQPAHQAAELNLRLPGQYFDAETGLHDNRWRTYNPANGHYLQPDPMPNRVGYAQGFNPYLYVGGDPLNRIDPLGLYEEDTHYYMTFFLALVAGVDYNEAITIAMAAKYIDDNPSTRPLDPDAVVSSYLKDIPGAIKRLQAYHFTQGIGDDPARTGSEAAYFIATGSLLDLQSYKDRRIENPNNQQLQNLYKGVAEVDLSKCAKLQFFGEYLHAFEDAFGHRDKESGPIQVNAGFGHLLYGHEPDKTYNDTVLLSPYPLAIGGWTERQHRTLEMEKEVYGKMSVFVKPGSATAGWSNIEGFLDKVNAVHEEGANAKSKLTMLQDKLDELGMKMPNGQRIVFIDSPSPDGSGNAVQNSAYDVAAAAVNRRQNYCVNGSLLKQADYPGTILPTSSEATCK